MTILRAATLLMDLLALLFGYELIECIMLKAKKPLTALLLALTLFTFILGSTATEVINETSIELSPALMMSTAIVLTAAGLILLSRIERWKSSRLTVMSVKESVDTLPAGICFFDGKGLPVLTNTVMEDICRELLGTCLSDGRALWEAVAEKTELSAVLGRSVPVIRLTSGKVYAFTQYEAEVGGQSFTELIAADMTSEYTLTQELRRKQSAAGDINRRLRELNLSIGEAIKERELLQIKISIHDGFGKMLLLTKRSLLVEGSVNQDELLRLWKRNTMLLSNVQSERAETPYSASLRHAEELGVSVRISGDRLPVSPGLVELIDEAITAHVTNVLRHAHGSTAFIAVTNSENACELRFTNDGAQTGNIRERGGLANLRRSVEGCGGTMEIKSGESFEMTIRLPLGKGDESNGI